MFLTSLPCIMYNLVSMAVHLLWLLLVGPSLPPPSPPWEKRHFKGRGDKSYDDDDDT